MPGWHAVLIPVHHEMILDYRLRTLPKERLAARAFQLIHHINLSVSDMELTLSGFSRFYKRRTPPDHPG